jgi:PAS domain S-box-containing protein
MRWSRGLEAFGHAPDDAIDPVFWAEHIHCDDLPRVRAAFDDAVGPTRGSLAEQFRFRRGDGTWAEVEVRMFVERDPAGRAVAATGVMVDVTDVKARERAVLEAQRVAGMRVWEEDLRTGSVRMDLGTFLGEPSPRYETLPRADAWQGIHPDDLPRLEELRRRTIERGEPFDTEYRQRLKSGEERVVLIRGKLVRDASGAPERVFGAALDITDRKHAEEDARRSKRLLEIVLETLPVGVGVMDASGDIWLSNAATRAVWGNVIADGSSRYEKSVGYWHDTKKRVEVEEWGSSRAIAKGETSLNELVDIETFTGVRKTIRNSAAPIRDDERRIVGAVTIIEDDTNLVRNDDERARRDRQQTALAQLGLSALKANGIQALFEEACGHVARTLQVDYGLVAEALPAEGRMEFRAGSGPWIESLLREVLMPIEPGFMAWFCTRSPAPVVVEDLMRETRFRPCELLVKHGVRSSIVVPIIGRNQTFGVFQANATKPRTFTDDEVKFVWGLANLLAVSVEREVTAAEVRDKREQLQALSRRLIQALEEERRAIARELHDDFGQVLTALRLNLQRRSSDDRENLALVDGAIARMRDLAQDLRPPQLDELGLESSLRWFVQREAARAGLDVTLDIETLSNPPVATVATTCFRVVQEALTNVIRHAHARHVTVTLRSADGHLCLEVRDDGTGFDVAAARKAAARRGSHGLIGMAERVELVAGVLTIESTSGGTVIRAHLPLEGGEPS